MPSLEELLNDAKLLGDDVEIDLGGQKHKMADLRAISTKQKAKLAEDRKVLDAEMKKADRLADDALALFNKLKDQPPPKKDAAAAPDAEEDISDMDPRLVKKLTAVLAQMEKVNAQSENVNKAVTEGFNFVLSEVYYPNRWAALENKPEGKTWQDYYKIAQSKGIKNAQGLIDPVEAYLKETAPDREAAIRKAAREEGIAEGRKQSAAATPSRPGHRGPVAPKKEEVISTVEDLRGSIENDPDIMELLAGGGPAN